MNCPISVGAKLNSRCRSGFRLPFFKPIENDLNLAQEDSKVNDILDELALLEL